MPNKPSSQLSNYLITSKVIRADKSLRPDAIAITLHIGDQRRAVQLSHSRANWRLFAIRAVYAKRLVLG